jgi:hypothetical protein
LSSAISFLLGCYLCLKFGDLIHEYLLPASEIGQLEFGNFDDDATLWGRSVLDDVLVPFLVFQPTPSLGEIARRVAIGYDTLAKPLYKEVSTIIAEGDSGRELKF